MSESDKKKPNRRDFIVTATTAAGAVGVGAAVWPLIDQMNPDASVKALASTEVDISGVEPGQSITVLWRGKPVFIRRRTSDEIQEAKSVDLKSLKEKKLVNKKYLKLKILGTGEIKTKIEIVSQIFCQFVKVKRKTINTGKINSAEDKPNQPTLNALPLDFVKYLETVVVAV